jgi:hypothetical protein
MGLKVL